MLAVGRFRETDMWVRLLTQRHGVVRAFAFGGSRSRRRFSGCLDVLNFLRVRAVTSKNGRFLNLEEGVLLQGPQRLRSDLTRLGMAMNCVRFLESLEAPNSMDDADAHQSATPPTFDDDVPLPVSGQAQNGETPGPFALMHSLFTRLEAAEPVSGTLPVLFRLRLASDQGYAPPFAVCAGCSKALVGQGGFFSISEGVLLCPDCGRSAHQTLWVSAPALDVLAEVQATLPETWQLERLDSAQRRECLRLVDAFVQYHLGLTWDRGRFRRV